MLRILDQAEATAFLNRASRRLDDALEIVKPIVQDVRDRGDASVREYAEKLDGFTGESFVIDSYGELDPALLEAVTIAAKNIRDFAQQQLVKPWQTTTSDGRTLGQIVRPLNSVGVYVPAGRYPLLSTMLMTVIPAQVAGVGTITVVCPQPNTQILALAKWLGLKTIVQLGGAQAIASLAYGTQSIAKVQRIVGPGNSYVAAAKKLVAGDVGIDFVAGPSEIVLVANAGNPTWIAADMLAQCEHDVEARAILLTTSTTLATEVQAQVALQLLTLPTADVASLAVANNSAIIVCQSVEEIIELVNEIAPEHLAIPDESLSVASFVDKIVNAGSIFIGRFSTEAAGDYASGPNHVLPTSGVAALRGGLSVNDFVKVITTQSLSEDALRQLTPAVTQLARAEGLEAHARSVEVRQG
jgi:histidinol dehydrogenase